MFNAQDRIQKYVEMELLRRKVAEDAGHGASIGLWRLMRKATSLCTCPAGGTCSCRHIWQYHD